MNMRIKNISPIGLLRLFSNKNIRKPVIILPRGKVLASQPTAHGHDKTVFSDIDTGGLDAATMEISSDNSSPRFYDKKRLNVSMATGHATKKAKKTGYVTVVEQAMTDNQTMPYGLCSAADKKNAHTFLLALKAKHAKN